MDRGYNLTDSNGGCGLTGGTDLTNTDPQLGPLQANGGPTQTMVPSSTSPAIDDVPTSSGLCSATDQRGVTRPDQGETSCDIGAFESDYTTTTLTSSANPSVAHQAVTYTATVYPAPDGGTVEFTGWWERHQWLRQPTDRHGYRTGDLPGDLHPPRHPPDSCYLRWG